jgi:hypothetical protein
MRCHCLQGVRMRLPKGRIRDGWIGKLNARGRFAKAFWSLDSLVRVCSLPPIIATGTARYLRLSAKISFQVPAFALVGSLFTSSGRLHFVRNRCLVFCREMLPDPCYEADFCKGKNRP